MQKPRRANMREGHLFWKQRGSASRLLAAAAQHRLTPCENPLLAVLVAGAAGESWGHWAQGSAQGLETPRGVSFLPPWAQGWGTSRDVPEFPITWHCQALPLYERLMLTPGLCMGAFNSRTGFLQSRHGQTTILLSNQPEQCYTLCQLCAFMPDWCQLGDDRQFLIRHKVQVV